MRIEDWEQASGTVPEPKRCLGLGLFRQVNSVLWYKPPLLLWELHRQIVALLFGAAIEFKATGATATFLTWQRQDLGFVSPPQSLGNKT